MRAAQSLQNKEENTSAAPSILHHHQLGSKN